MYSIRSVLSYSLLALADLMLRQVEANERGGAGGAPQDKSSGKIVVSPSCPLRRIVLIVS